MRFVMTLLMAAVGLCVGVANAETPHSLTREDVDAWLDGLVPRALQAGDIAGGVVVIVKDGEILTERGFGYADVAAKAPVDPRTTVFHFYERGDELDFMRVKLRRVDSDGAAEIDLMQVSGNWLKG